jgi:hypothetical protein
MSPFRKQNMTSGMNMTPLKYMHLIMDKIIRTVINSTDYIKLRLHELQTVFLNNIYPPVHE